MAGLLSLIGLRRKKPAKANRSLLGRLAQERLAVFAESQRRPPTTEERAWFAAGALAALTVAERLGLGTLREAKGLALNELFTMPLVSYWHLQRDERSGRDPAEGAEARAASFRHLQVAYGDLRYGVGTIQSNAQDRLNDAMALDWQFVHEMTRPDEDLLPSTYEGLLAEKMVAVIAGIPAPLCGRMGLPVESIGELIERREDRAGFTAALEHCPVVRRALDTSYSAMRAIIADAEYG